jgi:hypothetical protein
MHPPRRLEEPPKQSSGRARSGAAANDVHHATTNTSGLGPVTAKHRNPDALTDRGANPSASSDVMAVAPNLRVGGGDRARRCRRYTPH